MRRILKWVVIVLVVAFIAIQLRRPVRSNPPVDESQTIFARSQMAPEAAAILNRSCVDCHSNKTVWPWYSHVAPVSWLLADDVSTGRQMMNLSEWGRLDPDRQGKKLRQMCDEVSDGVMPLWFYKPLHPASKLSPAEVKTLCDWTSAERDRISK